jgi:micrococcal nuclease
MIPELPYIKTNPDYIYSAVIHRWVDGDTVDVDIFIPLDFGFHCYQTNQFKIRVRLSGVNTPERGDAGYNEATQFANGFAPVGTLLTLKTYKMPTSYIATGTLGRYIADVYMGDTTASEALIASGLGVFYKG